jgi:hypothetical protein
VKWFRNFADFDAEHRDARAAAEMMRNIVPIVLGAGSPGIRQIA